MHYISPYIIILNIISGLTFTIFYFLFTTPYDDIDRIVSLLHLGEKYCKSFMYLLCDLSILTSYNVVL